MWPPGLISLGNISPRNITSGKRRRTATTFALVFGTILSVACTTLKPAKDERLAWQFPQPTTEVGAVQRAGIVGVEKEVYLATLTKLYQVVDGRKQIVSEPPKPDARILLAPGGGVYAWLIPLPDQPGLHSILLRRMPAIDVAELRSKYAPRGEGGLLLGFQGNLIVTITPLDDWQGVRGRFRYSFWNNRGDALTQVVLSHQYKAILDPAGTAILLLGRDEAIAYSSDGRRLWRVPGHYRKGAIAKNGALALLNPAETGAIDQVIIYRGTRESKTLRMPTPVHHLALPPSGDTAAVVGSEAKYFFLDPVEGKVAAGPALPVEGYAFVTDIKFIDEDTLAFGLLHRTGEPPKHKWPEGSVIAIDRQGHTLFRKTVAVREPVSSFPAIDATFGIRSFVVTTADEVFFVRLQPPPIKDKP